MMLCHFPHTVFPSTQNTKTYTHTYIYAKMLYVDMYIRLPYYTRNFRNIFTL